MPPHCDSLDGPVVTAARRALAAGDVDVILPYVPAGAEDEVREAFTLVLPLQPPAAQPPRWRSGGSSKRWCDYTAPVSTPRTPG